jgi:RND family efflux transporter MFP subunit
MIPIVKLLAPVVILAAGVAGANWLKETAPEVPLQAATAYLPLVEVLTVQAKPQQLSVHTHGEVRPAHTISLLAEVAAKVIWKAPEFEQGALVQAGSLLLKLDPTDYQLALASAAAGVAQARAALALEEAEAQIARRDWQEIGQGEAPPLAVREPQLAMARANLSAALAGLARAQRDLDRCQIVAPYSARLSSQTAELGQYLVPGSQIASLFASDRAEVVLPIRLDQLAWLNMDLSGPLKPLRVEFETEVGGETQHWQGTIDRTTGALDPASRMLRAIAVIEDPLSLLPATSHPALAPGLFVRAKILGKTFPSIISIPRVAMREDQTVLVVDADNRLHIRSVEVLQEQAQIVHLASGLQDQDRVCLTPLSAAIENMLVQILPTPVK